MSEQEKIEITPEMEQELNDMGKGEDAPEEEQA